MVTFQYRKFSTQYVLNVPTRRAIAAYDWLARHKCDCDRIYTHDGYCRMLLVDPSKEVVERINRKYPLQIIDHQIAS